MQGFAEQVLHVAGPGIANFYNIYDPAQGTLNGLLSIPEFANPVQFICGGSFETAAGPKYSLTLNEVRLRTYCLPRQHS